MQPFNPLAVAIAAVGLLLVTYLSARRPKAGGPRQGLSDNELLAIMKQRCRDAVATAKTAHDFTLDYSPDSVQEVEAILAQLHEEHLATPFDQDRLTKECTKWGAYVGEVIKKLQPSEWALDSAEAGPWTLPIVYADASRGESFPVAWCRKRIVDGPAADLWAKFSEQVLAVAVPSGAPT